MTLRPEKEKERRKRKENEDTLHLNKQMRTANIYFFNKIEFREGEVND